jgi:hypothetical protein
MDSLFSSFQETQDFINDVSRTDRRAERRREKTGYPGEQMGASSPVSGFHTPPVKVA